ncbi:hypothetical protein P3J6_110590 [Pseudoalteromonas sp. 3J6]|nr:hypothetical protein P3J6_110590 [Pseudoalteromonas sp. 3J6]
MPGKAVNIPSIVEYILYMFMSFL